VAAGGAAGADPALTCDHPPEWAYLGRDGVERCICGHERRWWAEQPAGHCRGTRCSASLTAGGCYCTCDWCRAVNAPFDALDREQPAPSGGSGDCWAELIGLVVAEHPDLAHLVPAMVARRRVGIERYGVPLGRGDGRDERRDLREEIADAAVYAQRLGDTALALRLLRELA
jgi:hypothetical protein